MTLSVAPPAPHRLDPPGLGDVDALLDETLAGEAGVLDGVGPELAALGETVRDLGAGGKRLRAAFCLWGADAASPGGPVPGAVAAAAALEMFHLGALVHDDVMDRSDLRRGRPTAHRRFAESHRRDGLVGDADGFGDAVATLLGDLCFSWADRLLGDAVDQVASAAGRVDVRRVWDRMRTETVAGQYLDLLAQGRVDASDDLTTRVLVHKSAKYTVERPLLLGGTLAGAPAALLAGYADLGVRVGEAFQLRDDVLGVFGDARVTGKPAGDDVREGKHTVLVAHAEAAATAAQRRTLRAHLGAADLDDAGLDAVRRVLTDTGALALVEARITALADGAHAVLERLRVPAEARAALGALIDASVWRSA